MENEKFRHGYGYKGKPVLIPDSIKPRICSELIPGKYYYYKERIPIHLLTHFNSYHNIKCYNRGQFVGMFNDTPIFKDWSNFNLALKRNLEKPAFMIYDALEIHEALGIGVFYGD